MCFFDFKDNQLSKTIAICVLENFKFCGKKLLRFEPKAYTNTFFLVSIKKNSLFSTFCVGSILVKKSGKAREIFFFEACLNPALCIRWRRRITLSTLFFSSFLLLSSLFLLPVITRRFLNLSTWGTTLAFTLKISSPVSSVLPTSGFDSLDIITNDDDQDIGRLILKLTSSWLLISQAS